MDASGERSCGGKRGGGEAWVVSGVNVEKHKVQGLTEAKGYVGINGGVKRNKATN